MIDENDLKFVPYPKGVGYGLDLIKIARTWTDAQIAEWDIAADKYFVDATAARVRNGEVLVNWQRLWKSVGIDWHRLKGNKKSWFDGFLESAGYISPHNISHPARDGSLSRGADVHSGGEFLTRIDPSGGVPGTLALAIGQVRSALARKDAEKKSKDERPNLAAKYLADRGLIAGKDYDVSYVIETANETAREEAVKEAKPEDGDFIDFSGSDNCEGCAGWDGESHRCECGNRRVGWARDGDFTNMTVYAEAN